MCLPSKLLSIHFIQSHWAFRRALEGGHRSSQEREKMNQNCRIETQFLETDSQVVMVDEGEKETHRMSREQWVGRLDNSEDQADIKPEGKIEKEMKPRERKL